MITADQQSIAEGDALLGRERERSPGEAWAMS